MHVDEAVRTLLAVRAYDDRPIADEIVEQIVDAGRLTGSSMNRQPWHFIVIQDRDTLTRLGELASSGPYIAEAPLAIAVVLEQSRFAVSDGSRAIQSMMLSAWGEGIGSNWVGFLGFDEVKKVLGIPAELDLLAILSFGYPTQDLGAGKKNRKPKNEVVHRERFGQHGK